LIEDESKKKDILDVIKECNDVIYSVVSPHIFNDNNIDSITHQIDNSYENLFFVIENESSINNVSSLSVYSFYKRLEIIEKRAKQAAKHNKRQVDE